MTNIKVNEVLVKVLLVKMLCNNYVSLVTIVSFKNFKSHNIECKKILVMC